MTIFDENSLLDYCWLQIISYIMIPDIPDDPAVVLPLFQKLRKNFFTGKTRPVAARKAALRNLIDGYIALKEEFNTAIEKDLGTNQFFSDFAINPVCIEEMEDLYANVDKWVQPESVSTPLALGMGSCKIEYEPFGLALVISAWNYPVYTAIPPAATAIAAGNCVILKPSEMAPHSSGVVKKLFDKYMDPQFYQVLEGRVEVAKAVSKLPFDVICFTGSTMTGRLVAIEAAKNLVPCLLELGGKCPAIIDETASIDAALNRTLNGKFMNSGQTCVGVDHVYVHESRKTQYKDLLMKKLDLFYAGNQNLEEDGNFGKIVNKFHVERLEKLLNENHGGNILYGGTVKKESRFINPTVIEEPRKDSLMMQEEIFGPIMPVFYYSNLQELIHEISSRAKPLAVYMFSESSKNINMVKDNTFSGAFVQNECVMQIANNKLPFGGVGGSGHGRLHGKAGFITFSNSKSVALMSSNDGFPTNRRYPPYTDDKKSFLRKLIKVGFITYGQIGKVMLVLLLIITAVVLCGVLIPRA